MKNRIIFLLSMLSFSILIFTVHLFSIRPVYGSLIKGEERISLPKREHISPVLEQPFFPLLSQRSFSTHDAKPVEQPKVNIAKRFRMRRHPDGGATDQREENQDHLGQAGPQSKLEDIPGIEFDSHGRPKKKEPGQKDEPLPRPGLKPPPPLPNSSGEMLVLNEPIPSRR